MKLDNKDQQRVLLELVEKTDFPGAIAEHVAALKLALRTAEIAKPTVKRT